MEQKQKQQTLKQDLEVILWDCLKDIIFQKYEHFSCVKWEIHTLFLRYYLYYPILDDFYESTDSEVKKISVANL